MGAYQNVFTMRSFNMSHAVGSMCSCNNVLRFELDSHADTCIVSQHTLLIHEHPKVAMVSGFDPSQLPRKDKVVDAAVRYTCRDTGDHLILMINQAIYVSAVEPVSYTHLTLPTTSRV